MENDNLNEEAAKLHGELEEALGELCNRFMLSTAVLAYSSRNERDTKFGAVMGGSFPEAIGLVAVAENTFNLNREGPTDGF